MPTNKSVEEIKCRRCGMLLKDCPKKRWTNPLCVVDGVEWDEHVIGLSALTSHTNTVLQGVVEKLQKEYGDHSSKALVIIESHIGGFSQMPGLDEVSSLLNDQIISNEKQYDQQ